MGMFSADDGVYVVNNFVCLSNINGHSPRGAREIILNIDHEQRTFLDYEILVKDETLFDISNG